MLGEPELEIIGSPFKRHRASMPGGLLNNTVFAPLGSNANDSFPPLLSTSQPNAQDPKPHDAPTPEVKHEAQFKAESDEEL